MNLELNLEAYIKIETEWTNLVKTLEEICKNNELALKNYDDYINIKLCEEGYVEVTYEHPYINIVAQSNAAGPGYFAYVATLYDAIIKSNDEITFSVHDDTNYFKTRNYSTLCHNINKWLKELLNQFIELDEKDYKGLALFWPDNYYLPKEKEGYIVTPTGYLNIEEIKNKPIEEIANKVFIWNHIKKDESYYINSAIRLITCDCYFDASLFNEQANLNATRILYYIEKAYSLNNDIAIPYQIYKLLCTTLSIEPLILQATELPEITSYRLTNINYQYDNWIINADGKCEIDYDDNTMILTSPISETNNKWQYTMYFNGYRFKEAIANTVLEKIGEEIENKKYEKEEYTIHYSISIIKDMVKDYCCLQAQIVNKEDLLMVNINFDNIEDKDNYIKLIEAISISNIKNEELLH
ncbi:MAG: hypothetical protein RR646_00245 [Erysipelotrichaceae bacterium]